ncbi:MAG: hypothetical protein IJ995_05640 [Clostridia bacterium]|nr:hypothetical protein [Clostridia bacterium]
MKRVLSVLLICALLMAGLAVVASAAPVSITVDAQKTGDNVVAQVKLNDAAAVESWSVMTAVVTYNSDALTFVNAESAMEGMQEDSTVAGKLLLCWIADPMIVPADGVVAELTFTAKAVTEDQPIDLKVGFYPDGMVLAGETEPMDNTGEANYSSAKAEPSDSIVIQPEESEDPDQPQDPDEPTSPTTITSTTAPNNKVSFGVKAVYLPDGETHKYKIDLSWTDMTYTFNAKKMWNPNELKWDIVTEDAYWTEADPAEITVVNHSSLPVTAKAEYEATVENTAFTFGETAEAATEETITVSIDACAEGTSLGNAPQKKIYAIFNPNGAVVSGPINPTQLGTIKVTIA